MKESTILKQTFKNRLIAFTGPSLGYPTGYNLPQCFNYANELADIIHKKISNNKNIHLLVRGHSGSIIAGIVAYRLFTWYHSNVEIHISRKPNDDCHSNSLGLPDSNQKWNSFYKTNALIIVDDLYASGATVRSILVSLKNHTSFKVDMLCVSDFVCKIAIEDIELLRQNIKYIACSNFGGCPI